MAGIEQEKLYKKQYSQGRERSWLKFDNRVLDEAKIKSVPLLERLNFYSIYFSNLNEYYMIRVGSLNELKRAGVTTKDACCGLSPAKQLDEIYEYSHKQNEKVTKVYQSLLKDLKKENIIIRTPAECSYDQKKYLNKHFNTYIKPLLLPRVIGAHHPLSNLYGKENHIIVRFRMKEKERIGLIMIPPHLPSLVSLNAKEGDEFVLMEDLIMDNIASVFSKGTVLDSCAFTITRNGDINPDDTHEFDDDYRKKVKKVLGKRRKQEVVRLTIRNPVSQKMVKYLSSELKMDKNQVFLQDVPLNYQFGFELSSLLKNADTSRLSYAPYVPKLTPQLDYDQPLFDQIYEKDLLLHYPYESMDPFLRLIKESSRDPDVVSIKITIYRLAKNAKLVEYLCEAAENGKEVIVLIELKARFDEQHNIDYSQRLEDAGCVIMYGFDEYKVHSKICQITRLKGKRSQSITQIGTGNYNEKTSKLYEDFAYFTHNTSINTDAKNFFNNMLIGNLDGHYRTLLIAPAELKDRLVDLVDEEAAKGENGRIILKMNSLCDVNLIEHLQAASQAGVRIDIIVRGICCMLPQVPGKTENVHIRSIVGRYLEHSRVYLFGKDNPKVFIGSADFMKRNTEKRVEIICPITDQDTKQKLITFLDLCLKDNVGAREMNEKGNLVRVKDGKVPFNSHKYLMETTEGTIIEEKTKKKGKVINSYKTKYVRKKKSTKEKVTEE